MAQLVKNPPTMRETWIQSLGWEDPLEKRKLCLENQKYWVCLGSCTEWYKKTQTNFLANSIFYHSVPDSSVGKESACNAGDPGSIPGLGISTGKERGYPLQYSWASLMAQLIKNLPAMWET